MSRRHLQESAAGGAEPEPEPEGKRRRLLDLQADPGTGPTAKKHKFKKLANITAKNKAAALLTKTGTGKIKKKPFKGLSYSFITKKKKKVKKTAGEECGTGADSLVSFHVRELGAAEAMKAERRLVAEPRSRDLALAVGPAVGGVTDELPERLSDGAETEVGQPAAPVPLSAPEDSEMVTEDEESVPPPPAPASDVQSAAGSQAELRLAISSEDDGDNSSESSEAARIRMLKGKARKSMPKVTLKKAFVPSSMRIPSPPEDSCADEDEESGDGLDSSAPPSVGGGSGGGRPAQGAASVASAVKRRRGSVTQPATAAALVRLGRRADSLTCSPAGSVTGGSGAGEAAPPEGTVPPPKMMDPMLTTIACKCVETKTPTADLDLAKEDYYCRGIDAIDGRLIGCCNLVTSTRMIRPSFKVPFLLMCGLHRERMRRHHCCPSCGVFCTQGIFMRCTHECTPHLFHRKCAAQVGDLIMCPHCGNSDDLKTVQLTIRTGRTPTFYHQQGVLKKSRSARMAITRGVERAGALGADGFSRPSPHLSPYRLTLPDGRVLAANGMPVGPDREQLERSLLAVTQSAATVGGEPKILIKDQLKFLRSSDLEKLISMIAQGWSPNQKYRECGQQTALHVCAEHGHVAAAHLLVTAGAALDPVDRDLQTPLMVAAARAQNSVLKYLVTAGAALDAKGEDGMTPLHLAAQAGNLEGCHYLLSSGRTETGYVNRQDDGGWTPVVWASEHKHPVVVKYLLERGANPQLCDEEQNTGLHWAAFSGSMEIAELFLAAGCHVNSPNVHGDTPLHIAARQRHYHCTLLMLAHGANLYLRNREGSVPLDCCGPDRTDTRLALLLNMELSRLAERSRARRGERVLSNDVSRGKEKLPIQAVNDCDDSPLPSDYVYVAESCETMKLNIDRTITSLQSCACVDNCISSDCMCSQISLRCWYDPDGRLLPEFNYTDPPMIFECNRACGCNQLTCNNRAVQHGITCRVQMYRTTDRGWGVRALKHIPKGTYVCEYVGEIITDSAADQREDDSYLFDLDNRDGDTFCLDARRYGNVSRFINHRCEPNLVPVKVFVDHQDVRFPRIALFACRDVEPAEELGFDYGEKFWMVKYKMFTCKCGSPKCKYSSESIHVTLANYNKKLAEAEQKAAK
ncbi:Histone-lysine N-methyltransferase EHMT2 [Amphibalanus amphitrite]|uniref:Histone-lysine N-methyltransferase EHMT2 n=1 Tax=Amphibalanus amphitrite TaxID=1232801 RepID=A0A6A4W0M5_AMPAM|nr:Histone-lysine N-methyltransferase EHMT2 [Amphibalanus amphitrite]